MVHGVVGHDVSFLSHPPDQVRVLLYIVAHQEKGGPDVMGLQCVQDPGGAAVFVARVKGQVQYLFRGIADVSGIVLPQLVRPGIADGGGPLLPEAQAPGAGGNGAAAEDPHRRPHRRQNRQQQ